MQVGLGTDVAAGLVVVSYGWGGTLQVDVLGGVCVWGAVSAFGMPGQVSVVAGCLSLHLLPPITYNNFLWGILLLRHILEQYVNDNSSGFDQTSQKFQTWILQTKKECNQKTTLQKYYPEIINQYRQYIQYGKFFTHSKPDNITEQGNEFCWGS